MNDLLLDTCAVLFLTAQAPSRRVDEAMRATIADQGRVFVSPITAWEIGMLAARGRFVIAQRAEVWFAEFLRKAEVSLAPMPANLLIASSFLPGRPPRDPWDRIIAATAREFGQILITRDRSLLEYADAGHINALPC